jgi:hypothetical protein
MDTVVRAALSLRRRTLVVVGAMLIVQLPRLVVGAMLLLLIRLVAGLTTLLLPPLPGKLPQKPKMLAATIFKFYRPAYAKLILD